MNREICSELVEAVRKVQPGDVPDRLLEGGARRGDDFDANRYFEVLTHLSMREGYVLDYVYKANRLGSFPVLYARSLAEAAPQVTDGTELPDFREYLNVQDGEQGYFEYVVMDIMAGQFYLTWHALYNDHVIVCGRPAVNEIIARIDASKFGDKLDAGQQSQARAIPDLEPAVRLTEDAATVQLVTFTKWGGFYRLTYTIRRDTPHRIVDVRREERVPYDCGVLF